MSTSRVGYGIAVLAILSLWTMFWDLVLIVLALMSRVVPGQTVLSPLDQVVIVGYLSAAAVVNILIAVGLLRRWNRMRIVAMVLSVLPTLGAILFQTSLRSTSPVPLLFLFTGISLPSVALPLVGNFTDPAMVVFGFLNLFIVLFLNGRSFRDAFQKKTSTTGKEERARRTSEHGILQ